MNQRILSVICDTQEALISLFEEDQMLRQIMRSSAKTDEVGERFRYIKHYTIKLEALVDRFEAETMRAQIEGAAEESD